MPVEIMKEQTSKKSRTLAIILSVFFGFFAWLYTYKYKYDKIKFWASFILFAMIVIISEESNMAVWFGFIIFATLDSILDKNKFTEYKKTQEIKSKSKSSEAIDKKWYLKPAGVAFVFFIVLITIGIIYVNTTDLRTNHSAYQKNYLLINGEKPTFSEFYNYLYNENLTDIQKDALFRDNKNKWVSWEIYVKSAENGGEYQVMGLRNPLSSYSGIIRNEIGVYIMSSERSKLINYSKGDKIRIEGQLKSYGNIIGSKIIYVTNAVILENDIPVNNSNNVTNTTTSANISSNPTITTTDNRIITNEDGEKLIYIVIPIKGDTENATIFDNGNIRLSISDFAHSIFVDGNNQKYRIKFPVVNHYNLMNIAGSNNYVEIENGVSLDQLIIIGTGNVAIFDTESGFEKIAMDYGSFASETNDLDCCWKE